MKKLLFIFFLVALPLSFATTLDELDSIATDTIDKPLQTPFDTVFGSERFNITIITENETVYYQLITDDGIITTAGAGEVTEPTVMALINISTIETILSADDQFNALVDAYDNNEIEITGVTFGNKVKIGVAKVFATVIGWFI